MKIYFAGHTSGGNAGVERERILIRLFCDRLFSFYWMGLEKEQLPRFEQFIKEAINVNSNKDI